MATKTTTYDTLTQEQRLVTVAATELYAKHCARLGDEARDLGKETDAGAYETEAEQLRTDTIPKLMTEAPQIRPHERKAIERGLTFYLKNLRAAKGTVKALGKHDLAEKFEQEAVALEADLVPQFREQMELKV